MRDYLRVDDDMDEIYAALSEDEHLVGRGEAASGLAGAAAGAVGVPDRVHLLGEQQHPAHHGECGGHGGELREAYCQAALPHPDWQDCERSTFPSPRELVDAGEQALRDLKLGFRAVNVIAAAEGIADGKGPDLYALAGGGLR